MSDLLAQAEFANEAFYLAFEGKDYDAMHHLWSQRADLVCLHPGWPALVGREAVMESWQAILANPRQGQVSFYNAQVQQLGSDSFAVVCYEQAGDAVMVAVNVFVVEEERLCMVSHQSGFCSNPPAPPA